MNKTFIKHIGAIVVQGAIMLSLLAPIATFAAAPPTTPTQQNPGTTNATQPATTVTNPNTSNTSANSPTAVSATGNGTDNQSAGPDGTFAPLTQLPGITSIANATSFSSFLNTLYKICIGIGAVLAVLMIMYAGVLFMTSSGSVTGNEKAKSYIQNALLGLVLVLTPTIVFGIINPSILNIDIGSEFTKLQTQLHSLDTGNNTDQVDVGKSVLNTCSITPTTQQQNCFDTATAKVYQDYNTCVAGQQYLNQGSTDCYAGVRSETSSFSANCISGLTNEQQSCVADGMASAIQNKLANKTTSAGGCTIYDKFKIIGGGGNQAADGSSLSCGQGWQRISDPGQCTQNGACNLTSVDQVCCGHLPSSGTNYLLAYHYTRAQQGKNSCIAYDVPKYFSTQASCSQMLNSLSDSLKAANGSSVISNLVVDQSCVQVTDQSYKPPVDPKACKTN